MMILFNPHNDITGADTLLIPSVSVSAPLSNIPALIFPDFYIIAASASQGTETPRVYRFEAAPHDAFAAWLCAIVRPHWPHVEVAMQRHRPYWLVGERWQSVNLLANAGLTIPWYVSRDEAIAAAKAAQ